MKDVVMTDITRHEQWLLTKTRYHKERWDKDGGGVDREGWVNGMVTRRLRRNDSESNQKEDVGFVYDGDKSECDDDVHGSGDSR